MMRLAMMVAAIGLGRSAARAASVVKVSASQASYPNQTRGQSANPIDEPRVPPNDISELQFTDIRVVGALGDSITAGFALNNLPSDNRGNTWCCGDNAGAITVSNFFKHYTDSVVSGVAMNVAVSGAVVSGMAGQARRFVTALQNDRNIDFRQDWKLLNIWIGANNWCRACSGGASNQPPAYARDLRAAIDILEAEVPRLFVNLVPMLNLTGLVEADGVNENCALQHAVLTRSLCPCVFPRGGEDGVFVDTVIQQCGDLMVEIQDEVRQKGRTDFAVIVQPGLREMNLPDWTYLSRLDCFHPSLLAHEQVAMGIWNNMMEPIGQKTTDFVIPVTLQCPAEGALIQS